MNKIYKVVWSKVKHCYVVVSEIAKVNGKSGIKSRVGRASLAAAMAVAVMMSGGVMSAEASIVQDGVAITGENIAYLGNGVGRTLEIADENFATRSVSGNSFINNGGTTNISDTTFQNITYAGSGSKYGIIYTHSGGEVNLTNVTFTNSGWKTGNYINAQGDTDITLSGTNSFTGYMSRGIYNGTGDLTFAENSVTTFSKGIGGKDITNRGGNVIIEDGATVTAEIDGSGAVNIEGGTLNGKVTGTNSVAVNDGVWNVTSNSTVTEMAGKNAQINNAKNQRAAGNVTVTTEKLANGAELTLKGVDFIVDNDSGDAVFSAQSNKITSDSDVTVNAKGKAFSLYGNQEIDANNVTITSADNDAIFLASDWVGNMKVEADGKVEITSDGGYAIANNSHYKTGTGTEEVVGTVDISGNEVVIVSKDRTAIKSGHEVGNTYTGVTNIHGNKVTIEGAARNDGNRYNSAIYAQDGEVNVTGGDITVKNTGDKVNGYALFVEDGGELAVGNADGSSKVTIDGNIRAAEGTLDLTAGAGSEITGTINTDGNDEATVALYNGAVWNATGASKVSNLAGNQATIAVEEAEEGLVTIQNNQVEDLALSVAKRDMGVDIEAGLNELKNTVVDGQGNAIINDVAVDSFALQASAAEVDGKVTTTIKPGDTFAIESDVVATGDVKAGDVSLKETAEALDGKVDAGTASGMGAIAVGNDDAGSGATASGTYSVAIGEGMIDGWLPGAVASGDKSIAIGTVSKAIGEDATAVGSFAQATGRLSAAYGSTSKAAGEAAVAIGYASEATHEDSVAIGYGSVTSAANTVSFGSEDNKRVLQNVAAGTLDTDAVNVGQLNTALDGKVDAGNASGMGALAVGASTAEGNFSTATGFLAKAKGTNTVAMGMMAEAGGENSIAVGGMADAAAHGSVAIGNAYGDGSAYYGASVAEDAIDGVALGGGTQVNGANSVALGAWSVADEDNVVSIGSGKDGDAYQYRKIVNVADGVADNDAANVGQLNTAIDEVTDAYTAADSALKTEVDTALDGKVDAGTASGMGAIAVGNDDAGSGATASGTYSVAIGEGIGFHGFMPGAVASGDKSIAIGTVSKAIGEDSVAIGSFAQATGRLSSAYGSTSSATGVAATAIGYAAEATYDNSVAIGSESVTSAANTVSFGSEGNERVLQNVAEGTLDTDVANVGQLNTAIDEVTEAYTAADSALKTEVNTALDGKVDKNTDQIVIGNRAEIKGNANGTLSNKSIVIGVGATSEGWTDYTLDNIVVGANSHVYNASNAMALGTMAVVRGDNGVATGTEAYVGGEKSAALGNRAYAGGENSVALGAGSSVSEDNVISVGHQVGDVYYRNGSTEFKHKDTLTRKIVNVADGEADTDAATVGQMKKATAGLATETWSGGDVTSVNGVVVATAKDVVGSGAAIGGKDGDYVIASQEGIISEAFGGDTKGIINLSEMDRKTAQISVTDYEMSIDVAQKGYEVKGIDGASWNIYSVDSDDPDLAADKTLIYAHNGQRGGRTLTIDPMTGNLATPGTIGVGSNELANAKATIDGATGDIWTAGSLAVDGDAAVAGGVNVGTNVIAQQDVFAGTGADQVSLKDTANKVATQGTKIEALENASATQSGKISALESVAAQHTDKIGALEGLTSQHTDKISALEGLTDQHADKISALESSDTQQNSKISALEGLTSEHSTKIDALENSDAQQNGKISALEGLTSEHSTKIDALEGAASQQSGKITALEDLTAQHTDKIGALENSDAQQNDKITALENDSVEQSGKITALEGLTSEHTDKITALENDSQEQSGKITALEDTAAAHGTAIDANKAGIAANTTAIETNATNIAANAAGIQQNANAIAGLNQNVMRLDGRLDKVGAGAAALAALHPLDYDAENKLSFSAGVGSYGGATAGAIGAFYRPNEDVMFSIGGTAGNGENMVNAGVSFAIGKGSSGVAKLSKAELVDKVQQMEEKYEAVQAENKDLRNEINELKAMVMALAAKK